MSKKPKSNIAKNVTTIKPDEPTGPIRLSEEHAAAVRAAEKAVVDMKCRLANLTIQQMNAASDTVQSERGLIDKISELARLHGIAPENAGKWAFDTKQMTFTRVGQQR